MKKLLLTLAAVGLAASVYAQGTVFFQNAVGGVGGRVTINGAATTGQQFTVQLLVGAPGTPFGSLTALTPFTSSLAGGLFYDAATKSVTAVAGGGVATFAIQGWTGNYANRTAAEAALALVGQTATWEQATGGAGSPPSAPVNLTGWVAGNPLNLVPVPEPSALALLGLGVLGLFTLRRK